MKHRLFIFLSALCMGACMSSHGMAESSKPNLVISGYTGVYLNLVNSKVKDKEGGRGGGKHLALDSTRINFDVTGVTEDYGGLEYSYLIGLSNDLAETNVIEENRIQIKSPYLGTFAAGGTRGPEDRATTGGVRVMGGSGGYAGNFSDAIVPSTGSDISVTMVGNTKEATKLVYYTPRAYGLQLGLGWTPDGSQKGRGKLKSSAKDDPKKKAYGKSVYVGNLNYQTCMDDWKIQLSLTGITGKGSSGNTNITRHNNIFTYGFGFLVSYAGIDFGADFFDPGKSLTNTSHLKGAKSRGVFNVATGYSFGVNRVALGYYHQSAKLGEITRVPAGTKNFVGQDLGKARAEVFSLTYDRNLAPGLGVYGEVNYFKTRTTKAAVDFQEGLKTLKATDVEGVGKNRGHSLIVGTKLKF